MASLLSLPCCAPKHCSAPTVEEECFSARDEQCIGKRFDEPSFGLDSVLDKCFSDMQETYVKHLRDQRLRLREAFHGVSSARGSVGQNIFSKAEKVSQPGSTWYMQTRNSDSAVTTAVSFDESTGEQLALISGRSDSRTSQSKVIRVSQSRLDPKGSILNHLPSQIGKSFTGSPRPNECVDTPAGYERLQSVDLARDISQLAEQVRLGNIEQKDGTRSNVVRPLTWRETKVVNHKRMCASLVPTRKSLERIELDRKKTRSPLKRQTQAEMNTKAADGIRQRMRDLQQNVGLKFIPSFGVRQFMTPSAGFYKALSSLINNPMFDTFCACMILFNSLMIGVATQWLTTHDEEAEWMDVAFQACSIFFLLELIARMALQGLEYFTCEERNWNIFDFVLVLFSIVDFVIGIFVEDSSAGFASSMKTIKMMRIIRIFRVFRFFGDLAQLAGMIINSCKSLVWALIMLAIIIYVFSICFTSFATTYLSENSDQAASVRIRQRFGSLGRTTNSLIESMLGGVSWGEISSPLTDIGWLESAMFFFFIFFSMLAVLNVITGVFVENAIQCAKSQRDFVINKEMELKEVFLTEMQEIFSSIDEDGSNDLTLNELETLLEDVRMKTYFEVLGIQSTHIGRLFKLLDTDNDGQVDMDEFLSGCLRLKGSARSIDMHSVMRDLKSVKQALHMLLTQYNLIDDDKSSCAGESSQHAWTNAAFSLTRQF